MATRRQPKTSARARPIDAAPLRTPPPSAKLVAAEPSKQKLVRDSFTIPALEYERLKALKQRAVQLARPAKKSELLRAGLMALQAMNDRALGKAIDAVPTVKTGRPKTSNKAVGSA